jgi:hypothetical protein
MKYKNPKALCHIQNDDGYGRMLCGLPARVGIVHGGPVVANCKRCLRFALIKGYFAGLTPHGRRIATVRMKRRGVPTNLPYRRLDAC